jgi:pyruvate,water dikinase
MSVISIDNLTVGEGGGKAAGLAFLKKTGRDIPETFIVNEADVDSIQVFVKSLPNNQFFAIRSSAADEDGAEHSFAGQYETFLNISGHQNIIEAINDCFLSAKSGSVASYKKEFHFENGKGMNVLVQKMIGPKYSGVLFTVNPVTNRYDQLVLSIVSGLGDNLMSGTESGENLTFFKHENKLPKSEFLSSQQLKELIDQAKSIENDYNQPADIEWVIDTNNKLWWLQIRPITMTSKVHFNEFDHQPRFENPIYTRANIGEMMPGPVTPLSLSVFARAIDVGLYDFYQTCGALKDKTNEFIFIHSYYNHLFFDLQALYNLARSTAMATKENIDLSVVGEIVPNVNVKTEAGLLSGILNSLAMIKYVNRAPKAAKELKELAADFTLIQSDNLEECYQDISKKLEVNHHAFSLHYNTSSQSGSYYSLLLNLFSKGKVPTSEHQEKVASLYTDIPDIESAHVVKSIDELALVLSTEPNIRDQFLTANFDTGLEYLKHKASLKVTSLWAAFMERHGHRCVREAELREKEWAADPSVVLEGLKSKTIMLLDGQTTDSMPSNKKLQFDLDGLNPISKMVAKNVLPKARKAVATREQTKAWSIKVQYEFKKAYRHLANLLVKKGWLNDTDLIFFLTHSEIGDFIRDTDKTLWIEKAKQRRKLVPGLNELRFADISFGIPVPEEIPEFIAANSLRGTPVSKGITEGRVRLVNSIEDARKLQRGEIMVSRYTDIGWTPFYSTINGLVTEIGSPLSHGAVVAREYKLPTIVNAKGAMSSFKTGQLIRVDATKGFIELLEG